MPTKKVFGKFVIMFVLEIDDYKDKDISDYEIIDFFSDDAIGMDLKNFDWKEKDEAQKWSNKWQKKGYAVREVDDEDDSYFLIALKPEMWPTVEYICSLMTNPAIFTTPDFDREESD